MLVVRACRRILMRGRSAHFVPCTALGCIQLLERSGVPIRDKSVVVMGDSNIVGMPLAMLFRCGAVCLHGLCSGCRMACLAICAPSES